MLLIDATMAVMTAMCHILFAKTHSYHVIQIERVAIICCIEFIMRKCRNSQYAVFYSQTNNYSKLHKLYSMLAAI